MASLPNLRPLNLASLTAILLAMVCSLAAHSAESDPQYLNVAGTVPLEGQALDKDGVGRQIVIFFDAGIRVPEDSEGNKTRPFTISPSVPGQFRAGPNFISYTPVFSGQLSFKLTLDEGLTSMSGKPINPEHRVMHFITSTFKPLGIWILEENRERTVLGLNFPLEVNLNELKANMSVASPFGEDIEFLLEAGSSPRTTRIVLPSYDDWPVRVTFKKGLGDAGGRVDLAQEYTLIWPANRALNVREIRWERYGRDSHRMRVGFDSSVDGEDLLAHIKLQDAGTDLEIPFEIMSLRGKAEVHYLKVDLSASANIRVSISEGLEGRGKRLLTAPYSVTLRFNPTPLLLEYARFYTHYRDGMYMNLRLNMPVNAKSLREHIEISPEVPGLVIEPQGYRYFNIRGEWNSEERYTIKLKPGMEFGEGSVLEKELSRTATSNKVPPQLNIEYEGKYYFPRVADGGMPIISRNIDKAKVTVYRLFPSNLPAAIRDLNNGNVNTVFSSAWCEQLDTSELQIESNPDRLVTTQIEVDSVLPEGKRGVFFLQVTGESVAEAGAYPIFKAANKLMLFTDIGVLAHWRNEELVLFAHDLFSLDPIRSAKVTLYSTKRQKLTETTTNDAGIVVVRDFDSSLGYPWVAVVEHGDDFTFLELSPRNEDSKAFSSPMPPYNREAYDGFIYADRELYRPGDTVHLRWIVRTNYGDAAAELPLQLEVIMPNGQSLVSETSMLSEFGGGTLDVSTQKTHPTGKYTARLLVPGTKRQIGSYRFSVEDFVPNRIKTEVKVEQPYWESGKEYKFSVNSQHLFGGPATDRRAKADVLLRKTSLETENWKEYHFGNDAKYTPETIRCGEGRTDEDGNAEFSFRYEARPGVTFPLKATAIGRVFELGGRAVAGKAEKVLYPSKVALGVSLSLPPSGRNIEVFVAAINPDETPADLSKVKVTVEKRVWDYYVRRYYGHHSANWSETYEEMETKEAVVTDGMASAKFTVFGYGQFRIRVHSDDTKLYSTKSFSAYGSRCYVSDPARPSLIKLELDKEKYEVGDEVALQIESPFDGKAVVVLQGESIEQILTADIKNNVGVVRFKVSEEHVPNIWAEVTALHEVSTAEENKVRPFSSFAVADVIVEEPSRKLSVDLLGVPETIRPETKVSVSIEVADSNGLPVAAEITLAAVDEGIHLITGYANPDPYSWMNRSRRPYLRRAHYYDKIAYDFDKASEAGGAIGGGFGERVSAVGENWIRAVALWSGVVTSDANGKATVDIDVPDFTGQLRLVAVASSDKALGAASEKLIVRREYSLRTSMPRFLLPGDETECSAVLFNHTDEACTARLSWSVSGKVRGGSGSQRVQIDAHGEAGLSAEFVAGPVVGQGEISWEAVIFGPKGEELEKIVEVAPIPVRPPAAYQSHHELTAIKGGATLTFQNTKFIDDERTETEISVGASPLLRLQEALRYLIGYPYGCVEQTTSRLMPMYLIEKESEILELVIGDSESARGFIEAGIDKLFSMQTSSGGLGTWPGSNSPYPYGSVYAFHFLTLVEQGRDFDLPKANMKALKEYVRGVSEDWSNSSSSGSYLRAYALFTLAIGGDLEAIKQIERFDSIVLPNSARMLLAAALAKATQDMDRVKMYLDTAPTSLYTDHEPDGTLNSDIRSKAVELLVLNNIDGDLIERERKAQELLSFLTSRRHGSTQETAFTVTALADYFDSITERLDLIGASIEDPDGKVSKIEERELHHARHKGPGGIFKVSNTGVGTVYVNFTTRGVPERPEFKRISEGMSVSRHIYAGDDKPISLSKTPLKKGDTYVVEIEIECKNRLKNVVVADLLPAGLEIENPRLDPDAMPAGDWGPSVTPTHMELRDDRLILVFDDLRSGPHKFYYVARAVTPGSYQYPAIEAECMYDARVRARSMPREIRVVE